MADNDYLSISTIIGIGILLILIGVVIDEVSGTPECVQNTLIAIEWAENELHMRVACGGVCVYAVNQYLQAHNLTDEEFPTCCWSSDGGPPMSLGEKIAIACWTGGILCIFVGGTSLIGASLKRLFRKVRGGEK